MNDKKNNVFLEEYENEFSYTIKILSSIPFVEFFTNDVARINVKIVANTAFFIIF